MRWLVAIPVLLFSQSLLSVEAPRIVEGDYLLVYAMIVGCSSDLRAIEAGKVDENGVITLFEDIAIPAEGRPIHTIKTELLDILEQKTSHRSKTLELHHVPRADHKNFTMRMMFFMRDLKNPCHEIVIPPGDFEPRPFPVSEYERLGYFRNVSADTFVS